MTLGSSNILKAVSGIDWILFVAIIPIVLAGLFTMNSFSVGNNDFFSKQLIWLSISVPLFFIFSFIDFKFLRRTSVIVWLFMFAVALLSMLFIVGSVYQGSQSWFNLGVFSFQPAELVKLILIIVLAKYFSRRHIEIKNIRHIIVSGVYAAIFFLLILAQGDFGSALIIGAIWFGMVLVSGISKKHLLLVFAVGALSFGVIWTMVLQPYQKTRIVSFLHPLQDIRGAGYNAYQSTITVGSGQLMGKGLGFGSQSRLQFLPEYQTDFIFAAFAEEWGFIGVLFIFLFYVIVVWRILNNALHGATNFEILFGIGLVIMFMSHFIIHVGMNIGLLPVTGITIPFMSYGGTHLIVAFAGLGILMGMRRYAKAAHKDVMKNEFLGI